MKSVGQERDKLRAEREELVAALREMTDEASRYCQELQRRAAPGFTTYEPKNILGARSLLARLETTGAGKGGE